MPPRAPRSQSRTFEQVVGEVLRELREARGLSQERLGNEAGSVAPSTMVREEIQRLFADGVDEGTNILCEGLGFRGVRIMVDGNASLDLDLQTSSSTSTSGGRCPQSSNGSS